MTFGLLGVCLVARKFPMWPPLFKNITTKVLKLLASAWIRTKKLLDFTMENKMTWQEYFDGKNLPRENKLASRYGIAHSGIPMDFLLDGNGKIIGKNLRGGALPQAVAKALAK